MKINCRKMIILSMVLCLLLTAFTGCGGEKTPETKIKTIEKNGTIYNVDTESSTISDGANSYSYAIGPSGTKLIYPNGQSFLWKVSGGTGTGTATPDFDFDSYANPMLLLDVLDDAYGSHNTEIHRGNTGLGILLIIAGAVYALWPDKLWLLNWGWRFKDAEPSELALGLSRAGGILAVIIGILVIIF